MGDDQTIVQEVVVRALRGLHARPAGRIVRAIQVLDAMVRVRCNNQEADAHSVLELMALAATQGSVLHITASGPDACAAILCIAEQCTLYREEEPWPGP